MFEKRLGVPDFEYCKKLKELGYPQDGGDWYWIKLITWGKPRLIYPGDDFDELVGLSEKEFFVKAPTVGELGKLLPDFVEFKLNGKFWIKDKENYRYLVNDRNEANARAKMLIWLIENDYVSLK